MNGEMIVGRAAYKRIDGIWHARYLNDPPGWTRVPLFESSYETDLLDEIDRLRGAKEAS